MTCLLQPFCDTVTLTGIPGGGRERFSFAAVLDLAASSLATSVLDNHSGYIDRELVLADIFTADKFNVIID